MRMFHTLLHNRANLITLLVIVSVLIIAGLMTARSLTTNSSVGADSDIAKVQRDGGSSYTDLEGRPVTLDTYAGTPLVINSWATWCPFCVNELPDFATLKAEFGDQIEVIAINRKEAPETARAFVDTLDRTDGVVFLLDADDTFYESIGGFSMPETVFYDAHGNSVVHKRGFMSLEEMRQHTEKALNSTE